MGPFIEPTWYAEVKFWLPLITAGGLIYKAYASAKKSATEFAEKLLGNHLHTIQDNTKVTADTVSLIGKRMEAHEDKEMQVWQGVVNTLSVLEDRTRRVSRRKR